MKASVAPKGPIRTCISCRESARKEDLLRVVKQGELLTFDLLGVESGRGHYVHVTEKCINISQRKLRKAKSFSDFHNQFLLLVEGQLKKDRSSANRFGWLDSAGLVQVTNKVTKRIQTLQTWMKQFASATTSGC
jgi:predicted RNA-binding protein YlxR (DUF448 family)